VIHDDCELALHVQSRSTSIANVPVPPPEAKADGDGDTVAWHLEDDAVVGAATLVEAELPQPAPKASAPASDMSAA
jgi:hypothetical protein